jgi:hypothetical protein
VTATLTPRFVVTDDELQVVADRVGVQALPVVLGIRPRHSTESALIEAADHATRALTDRGLIHDGEARPELAALLRALQRPDRELAMRLVTPEGIAGVAVVRQGAQCISARRVANEIVLEVVAGEASLSAAAQALVRHLPASAAAEVSPVGAPLDAAVEALSGTHDSAVLSDRIGYQAWAHRRRAQRLTKRPVVDHSQGGFRPRHQAGHRPACRAFHREMGGVLAIHGTSCEFSTTARRFPPDLT